MPDGYKVLLPIERETRSATGPSLMKTAMTILLGWAFIAPYVLSGEQATVNNNRTHPTDGSAAVIEEIVVNEERRLEPLKAIPSTVAAFSGDDVHNLNAPTLIGLSGRAPGLSATTTPANRNAAILSVRGHYQQDSLITVGPTVGVYVDDIYYARSYGILSEFLDMQQVEVLYGPQGTRYGRDTVSGAIKLTTRKPELDGGLSGYIRGSIGNYRAVDITGAVNLPVVENRLAVRYATRHYRHDGYVDVYFAPPRQGRVPQPTRVVDVSDQDGLSQRLSLAFQPDERFQLNLSLDAYDAANNGHKFVNTGGDIAGIDPAYDPSQPFTTGLLSTPGAFQILRTSRYHQGDFYALASSSVPASDVEVRGLSASLNHRYSRAGSLRLTFGERRAETSFRGNAAGVFFDDTVNPRAIPDLAMMSQEAEQQSFEFAIEDSAFRGRLDWIGGIYLLKEEGEDFHNFSPIDESGNALSQAHIFRFTQGESRTSALYAHGRVKLSQRLGLDGGIRYTRDANRAQVDSRAPTVSSPLVPQCLYEHEPPTFVVDRDVCKARNRVESSYWTWSLGLDYQFNNNLFGYTRLSTGRRSGGPQAWIANPDTAQPYEDENIISAEAGIKSVLFGQRVRLDASSYYTRIKDRQVNAPVLVSNGGPFVSFTLESLVATEQTDIRGVELSFTGVLTAGFGLEGALGYLIVDNGPPSDKMKASIPALRCFGDASLVDYDQWTRSIALTYQRQFTTGALSARLDYHYHDQFPGNYFSCERLAFTPAYELFDARISYQISDNINAALFARNLNGKEYYRFVLPADARQQNQLSVIGSPRTYGLEISYQF